jgi:hypothetical protein
MERLLTCSQCPNQWLVKRTLDELETMFALSALHLETGDEGGHAGPRPRYAELQCNACLNPAARGEFPLAELQTFWRIEGRSERPRDAPDDYSWKHDWREEARYGTVHQAFTALAEKFLTLRQAAVQHGEQPERTVVWHLPELVLPWTERQRDAKPRYDPPRYDLPQLQVQEDDLYTCFRIIQYPEFVLHAEEEGPATAYVDPFSDD